MGKSLKDMSLEELWELFPVEQSPHRPEWAEWAREESAVIERLLLPLSPTVTHIGSTAIPGICAKPTVDLLVEIGQVFDQDAVRQLMENAGYICMSRSDDRMSFNKGYTPDGYAERVFHIHVRHAGDNDEIRFRDYLLAHPDEAASYERLKQSLLPRLRNDRDGYTAAKTEFVRRIVSLSMNN